MNSADHVADVLNAGRVRRFHTVPSHPHQTVAEHSWGVAMILLFIYPGASASMLLVALTHDVGERVSGDAPGHAKWSNPDFARMIEAIEQRELERLNIPHPALPGSELTRVQVSALKCADLLDLLLFCRRFSYDREMRVIEVRVHAYLNEFAATLLEPFPRAKELLHAVN